MARPIAVSIRSLDFGLELARMIDEACRLPLGLNVVRVGAIESRATPESFRKIFPAVFVTPAGAVYAPTTTGNAFNVTDSYRIAYALPIPAEKDVLPLAIEGLQKVTEALAADSALAAIANDIDHDQVTGSTIEGIEYDPEEDAWLDQDVPVKVVVLRWQVQWRTC